jgi:hypothetical protein
MTVTANNEPARSPPSRTTSALAAAALVVLAFALCHTHTHAHARVDLRLHLGGDPRVSVEMTPRGAASVLARAYKHVPRAIFQGSGRNRRRVWPDSG